jgi:hypothetical protein
MNKLEVFGKLISEDLRDSALNHYLDIEAGWSSSPENRELHEKLSVLGDNHKSLVRKLITDSIDAGIHDFLFALEEKKNGIEVIIEGENIAKLSDGLQGEPFSGDGWFEKYSQHKETGI